MFIQRLLNQGNQPLAERVLKFTAARHRLLQENLANVSTPGYRNKDLDMAQFQSLLQDRVAERREAPPGMTSFADIAPEEVDPNAGLLFHDRNNRSMEQLTVDGMKNALMHNLVVELMRKQFSSLEAALKERLT